MTIAVRVVVSIDPASLAGASQVAASIVAGLKEVAEAFGNPGGATPAQLENLGGKIGDLTESVSEFDDAQTKP